MRRWSVSSPPCRTCPSSTIGRPAPTRGSPTTSPSAGPSRSAFQSAARGSEVPEDWFNLAMAKVKSGDIEGAHASWQRTFDLSYAHPGAPETSTFFQKKLLFAQALRDAGACDPRGLDLLERQLLPFFTNYHVTDASFWGLRGVPALEEVLATTLDYYRALGKTPDEWRALLDGVAAKIDDDGKAYCEEMKRRWPSDSH